MFKKCNCFYWTRKLSVKCYEIRTEKALKLRNIMRINNSKQKEDKKVVALSSKINTTVLKVRYFHNELRRSEMLLEDQREK